MSHNDGFGQVEAPQQMGAYGYVNRASANSLYKRYKKFFHEKYGRENNPMSFPDWMRWAKSRGIVKSADGDPNEVYIEAENGMVEQAPEDMVPDLTKVNRMGRYIAGAILFFSVVGIIYFLLPTPVAQPAGPAPMPSPAPTT